MFSTTEGTIVLCTDNIDPLQIFFRDFSSQSTLRAINLHQPATSMQVAPYGAAAFIAVGSETALSMVRYDGEDDDEEYVGPAGVVSTVQFSPDGSRVVSAGRRHVCVWDMETDDL